jgi:hypothetical protein
MSGVATSNQQGAPIGCSIAIAMYSRGKVTARYTRHVARATLRRNDDARHEAGRRGASHGGAYQSPITRRPNTIEAKPTFWALPLMLRRTVVSLAKNASAWASVSP